MQSFKRKKRAGFLYGYLLFQDVPLKEKHLRKQWQTSEKRYLYIKDVVKVLTKYGFSVVSQKGSHIKLKKTVNSGFDFTVIVPNHKIIKKGTLRNGILKPINLTVEQFVKLLKK